LSGEGGFGRLGFDEHRDCVIDQLDSRECDALDLGEDHRALIDEIKGGGMFDWELGLHFHPATCGSSRGSSSAGGSNGAIFTRNRRAVIGAVASGGAAQLSGSQPAGRRAAGRTAVSYSSRDVVPATEDMSAAIVSHNCAGYQTHELVDNASVQPPVGSDSAGLSVPSASSSSTSAAHHASDYAQELGMLTDFQDMNEEQLRKGVVVELWAIQETHLVKDVKALVIDGYGALQRNRTTEKRGRRYHGGLLIMYILSIVLTELKSGSYGGSEGVQWVSYKRSFTGGPCLTVYFAQ
jgi:hypothetical protein